MKPDLVVYGKAVANGFPLAVVGGKAEYMDSIIDPDPRAAPLSRAPITAIPWPWPRRSRRCAIWSPTAVRFIRAMEALGAQIETGIMDIFRPPRHHRLRGAPGSAFSFYLMEKPPADLHDIIAGHDFNRDVALRRALIQRGVFFVPIATKQCSLSAAHTVADVAFTLEQFESAVAAVW